MARTQAAARCRDNSKYRRQQLKVPVEGTGNTVREKPATLFPREGCEDAGQPGPAIEADVVAGGAGGGWTDRAAEADRSPAPNGQHMEPARVCRPPDLPASLTRPALGTDHRGDRPGAGVCGEKSFDEERSGEVFATSAVQRQLQGDNQSDRSFLRSVGFFTSTPSGARKRDKISSRFLGSNFSKGRLIKTFAVFDDELSGSIARGRLSNQISSWYFPGGHCSTRPAISKIPPGAKLACK